MARVEMTMPKMGESIMEGTVLKWLKQVGDAIEQDESVLEVATDKVDTEVPALHAGTLAEILVQEGEVVAVGAPIARIETEAGAAPTPSENPDELEEASAKPPLTEPDNIPLMQPAPAGDESVPYLPGPNAPVAPAAPNAPATMPPANEANPVLPGRFYSPLVLSIAREEGISMSDLERLPGTGQDGRVTKKDILDHVAAGKPSLVPAAAPATTPAPAPAATAPAAPAPPQPAMAPTPAPAAKPAAPAPSANGQPAPAAPTPPAATKPAPSVSGGQELVEMDRMRKMIAQRMVDSKRISPHVTSFVEADVTELVNWRNKNKDAYKKREGENLTFTPIFIQAVARAIQDYPLINVSVDGDYIIKKKEINIGVAVALPSGNLIVPVIHNADQLNLNGLSKKMNDLANRARQNKLKPEDLAGGTYTLSNVGSFGNVMGTPIIMQPQVAIMAVGAIKKKPAVIETAQGDLIGIRHFMFLSHSYDHRVVDGSLGGMFVRKVADYLEQFDPNTTV
ncbi:2-oxo acid dehydrogenase subunit E2 [Hymenobacter sp. UV11]|uniref:dihydrolipoamide acetyltransferase family protein n=1 Tax=Hymenobacter sp. UV11 TaxID=1849735 RepID=UPI00105F8A73|nr:dihydrolipoamide acetyltransferase family protein [Hymenobacter sp. UV11]TDN40385.1 2-oxoglutarate dehydrogenase [Hymenobacter sp. UV11]TFZ66613.1 2-oxo acid dehydrogenase subunit E2 [Hymenobacter sp. UV11]